MREPHIKPVIKDESVNALTIHTIQTAQTDLPNKKTDGKGSKLGSDSAKKIVK